MNNGLFLCTLNELFDSNNLNISHDELQNVKMDVNARTVPAYNGCLTLGNTLKIYIYMVSGKYLLIPSTLRMNNSSNDSSNKSMLSYFKEYFSYN